MNFMVATMQSMKKPIAWAMAVVAMGTASLSQAESTTVHFAAVVTSTDTGLPAVGSTIRGAVTFGDVPSSTTYWPSPIDCAPISVCSTAADHVFSAGLTRFWVDLGDTVIASTNVGLNVTDNAVMYDSVLDQIFDANGIVVDLVGLDTTVNGVNYTLAWLDQSNSISGVALMDATAFLSRLPQDGFFVAFDPQSSVNRFHAQLTSLSVSSVPEPTTMAMLAMGLGGMTLAFRQRKQMINQEAIA